MNLWLLTAGIAALLLDLVHIFLGGRIIHRPMVAANWPEPVKAVWSVVWHATTAMLAFGGVAFLVAAFNPDQAVALSALPTAFFIVGAALFAFYGLKRLGTLMVLPHWIAFGAIALLATVGLAA